MRKRKSTTAAVVVLALGSIGGPDSGLPVGAGLGISSAAARVRADRSRRLERLFRVSAGPPTRTIQRVALHGSVSRLDRVGRGAAAGSGVAGQHGKRPGRYVIVPAAKSALPWFAEAFRLLKDKFLSQLRAAGTKATATLVAEVEELARVRLTGLKASSEASYRKAWNRWAVYAASRGMPLLPATEVGVLA